MIQRAASVVLVALGSLSARLAGQTLVTGTITGNGRPVANASVVVDQSDVQAHSDHSGSYRLTVPRSGVVRITVRAVGFYPASRRMLLVAGDTTQSDFSLDPAAQLLDSITVRGTATMATGKMAAFEERRAAGLGRFYTRAMLASREHSTLADVLRMTSGLQLVRRPSVCGGGFVVATGRSGVIQWRDWMSCGGGFPMQAACYFAVFLDGVRFWVPGSKEPPDINQFTVQGLEGVEVYRGPAESPIQYQMTGSDCGVVLLWTREGHG